jgi:hypothetical protein
VRAIHLRALEDEVRHFDSHLMVSRRPNTADPDDRAAWFKLSQESGEPSEICLDGQGSESDNHSLEELLAIIVEGGAGPHRTRARMLVARSGSGLYSPSYLEDEFSEVRIQDPA